MKMWDESFGVDTFASVRVAFSEDHNEHYSHVGAHVMFDDGSAQLTSSFENSLRGCLLDLATKWEALAKVLRERAAKEPDICCGRFAATGAHHYSCEKFE